MTAVGWDDDWTGPCCQDPDPAAPTYPCEGPCCAPRPGLLTRLLNAIRPTPK